MRTISKTIFTSIVLMAASTVAMAEDQPASTPTSDAGRLRPYSRSKATSHYEVVIAMRGDEIVTLDPAAGYRARTWPSLEAEWRPAAYPALVVLGPRP